MSIFGSLGVTRAGFKTFLAAISILRLKIEGARSLADAGFKSQGKNLSLIMLDEDEQAEAAPVYEARAAYIGGSRKVTVSDSWKTWEWNVKMILYTAISCIISCI